MRLIAHRGLINGPNEALENKEGTIYQCLSQGFESEIDVWYMNETWYLGHDNATYPTSIDFLSQPGLWIHCKNFSAADKLAELRFKYNTLLNYFWHENDERTLTSLGYWWTFPNRSLGHKSIAVMPEWNMSPERLNLCLDWHCAGICSDYVGTLKSRK